jgi:hypothetical protein
VDQNARRRIAEYVRPLAVGLDGVTNYGDVQRIAAASERIAARRNGIDRDLIYLLGIFSGQEKWVSRMGHRSRTELFLGSLGVAPPLIQRLFRGLSRFEADPRTPEEEIVHDAVRLEAMGAYGIARHLVEGYRERMDFREMAAAIEEAADAALRTPEGEELAGPRREAMREFARRLRAEYAEFAEDGGPEGG